MTIGEIKGEAVKEFLDLFMADIATRTYETNSGAKYVYVPAIESAIENTKRTLEVKAMFEKNNEDEVMLNGECE